MLNEADLMLLRKKGISQKQIENQLNFFKTGFPFLKVVRSATKGNGIEDLDKPCKDYLFKRWEKYLQQEGVSIIKFVPASGAASRMFKHLYEFLEKENEKPETALEVQFFENIQTFPFYSDLNASCKKNEGADIVQLVASNQYKKVVENLLLEKGLNYGNKPKGMLKFHKYDDEERIAMHEHLVEGALYAKDKDGNVNVHFTVSPEHKDLFMNFVLQNIERLEAEYNVKYNISFSEQKSSTDTIAADANDEPFRDKSGKLFFRPGGHGALIENLNDLDADVIFIKNIDNVVHDAYKSDTVDYKFYLAGLLVEIQDQVFEILRELDAPDAAKDAELLKKAATFIRESLSIDFSSDFENAEAELEFYKAKLNRPIRICGMVKNNGEAGGGPFFVENKKDKTVSLQILESTQINTKDPQQANLMKEATHFNPVDLVCGVKNYKGEKFCLTQYVDPETGFISSKSKDGRELKALELPGLWNGAMSDWNTIFVEEPISTFNPVKTVNDLLKKEHSNK